MNIVVFACHPDDETFGCGGALLRHKANGDKIYWVIATDISEKNGFSKKMVLDREKEIKAVSRIYGFNKVYRLGIPTTMVDRCATKDIVGRISRIFKELKPHTVYLPFRSDVHSDHRIMFEAAYSCTKTFRFPSIRKILMMEALSETEFAPAIKECAFIPNYFVDVSDFFDKKVEAAKIYKSELKKHPFPRNLKNIKSLATFRGATAGCRYAEAFMLLKGIE